MNSRRNRLLTVEQESYLRTYVKGISNQELADRMNQEFGLTLKASQINSYKKKLGIKSGLTGRFEKGLIPANKGKKFPGRISRTSFVKRHMPHNTLAVGSEIIKPEGYLWVKIAEPNIWRPKHVLIWEEKNGERPAGHVIVFADQDRLNFDLDNLILISKKELAICNNKGLLFPDPQLSKTGILVSKILAKTKERREAQSPRKERLK